jgi:hypothetical protein
MQRKLTADELLHAQIARTHIQQMYTASGLPDDGHWFGQYLLLSHMIDNGTTDGKPYIEPQPEIVDGYRRATQDDVKRRDLEFWSDIKQRWMVRAEGAVPLFSEYHYRVPIDRIPTDEDAKQRPTVMVRHRGEQLWRTMPLAAVVKSDRPFITLQGTVIWRFQESRFPYPGELD